MTKINQKVLNKKYAQQAKNSEWDDLAFAIICLESKIEKEKSSKQLKLLNKKLEIFESEKESRVFGTFDMEYFLSKDYEEVSDFIK
jgi:hypothetical protein